MNKENRRIDGKTALIVVDVQKALEQSSDGPVNNSQAEKNILKLIDKWRTENWPLYFVQYYSPRPQSPFNKNAPSSQFKEGFGPLQGEAHIIKHFENTFQQTNLETLLKERQVETLIFTGFYTDQCIASSAKVANNLGFDVIVLADGSGTTDCKGYNGQLFKGEDIHQLTLGGLQRDNITVLETADIL